MTASPPSSTSAPDPAGSSSPPLSQIPPPTMTRPTAPPSGPSDQIKVRTVVGAANRNAQGCIVLTTDTETWDLIGDPAATTLRHAKVSVTGLPRPDLTSRCDLTILVVSSVTPVS